MSCIIFSDEYALHFYGNVNKHNVRIWILEDPHDYREELRDSEKVCVWEAMSEKDVIEPYYVEEPVVNVESYLNLLNEYFLSMLPSVPP